MATIHAHRRATRSRACEQMLGMAGMPMTICFGARPDRRRHQADRAASAPLRRTQGPSIAEVTGLEGDIPQMRDLQIRPAPAPRGLHVEGHVPATGVRREVPLAELMRGHLIPSLHFDSFPSSRCEKPVVLRDIHDIPTSTPVRGSRSCFGIISVVLIAESVDPARVLDRVLSQERQTTVRLKISQGQPDREAILIQLRPRARTTTTAYSVIFGLHWLNRLLLESV